MNSTREVHEVPHTTFLIDGFKYQNDKTKSYFLSHFHSDHYTGLNNKFNKGNIYCTEITYRLATSYLGVSPNVFRILKPGAPINVEGVTVHTIDANHCPGAVQFIFQLKNGKNYLHSGDLRFNNKMKTFPILQQIKGQVDSMYIDTTYANEKHTFAPQETAIDQIIQDIENAIKTDGKDNIKVFISAYNIGKERVLLKIAKTFECKIHVDERKYNVLLPCIITNRDELEQYFTTDASSTFICCVKMGFCGELWPYFRPNYDNMSKFIQDEEESNDNTRSSSSSRSSSNNNYVKKILGFIPSGWADGSNYNKKNATQTKFVNGVQCIVKIIPYSEHSNYNEILEYIKFVKPTKIIPTVYKDANDRRRIEKLFRNVTNRTDAKRKFINAFFHGSCSSSSKVKRKT